MAKKNVWAGVITYSRLLKKNVKNTQQVGELLKDFPPDGYMRDNISKNLVEIKTCKSSSLRRYVGLLNNFYYLVSTESDKKLILNKKIEIEKELEKRDD